MKKVLLALTAVVITFSAIAQSENKEKRSKEWKQERAGRGEGRNNKLEELNLSEDQKSQMKTLNETFRNQMQEVSKNESLSADAKKEKREAILQERKEKIESILSKEQKEKWQTLKKDRKQDGDEVGGKDFDKGRGRKGGFGRGGDMKDFTKDLNLSADQSSKIATLNESFKTRVKELRSNTSLSEEQKKESMRTLTQKHRSDIESILTTDQKASLQNKFKNKQGRKAVK
jgi:Spy/CpxP family protein refolding chaperone